MNILSKIPDVLTAIQRPYIYVLNLLYAYIGKVSEKWRDIVVESALGVILFIPFYHTIFVFNTAVFRSGTLGLIITFIAFLTAAVFSMRGRLEPVRLSAVPLSAYVLYVAAMTVSFVIKLFIRDEFSPLQMVWWLLMYIAVLPALFIVWANRGDADRLYRMLTRPYACIYTIYCLALPTMNDWVNVSGEYRFSGNTMHSNTLAIILFTGAVCCLYNIITEEFNVFSGIYWLGFAISGFVLMMTGSRTVIASVAVTAAAVLAYTLVKKERRAVIITAAACLVFVLAYNVAKPFYNNRVEALIIERTAAAVSADPTVSDSSAAAALIEQSAASQIAGHDAMRENRFSVAGKSLNGILNNRLALWQNYSRRLNCFGSHVFERTTEARHNHELMGDLHAHNYYIEAAFLFGVVPAVFCLLVSLAALVYLALRTFRHQQFEGHMIYCILAIFAFFFSGLGDYYGESLTTIISLMYVFALLPVFCALNPPAEDAAAEQQEQEQI